jgi:hypothetical protein
MKLGRRTPTFLGLASVWGVIGFLLLPVIAAAGSIDYTLTGSAGDIITFQLSSLNPVPSPCTAHPPDCFAVYNMTVTFIGSPISGLEIDFAGPSEFGGLGTGLVGVLGAVRRFRAIRPPQE